jgi:very-short-patch-repair endonuclease
MADEKERARAGRRNPTIAERALWAGVRRNALGWYFQRQHPIPPYVVDFACVAVRVVVEADGGQHARPDDHTARDAALAGEGWRLLRFWNNETIENLDGVLTTIKTVCDAAGTPSPPSPAGGGGSRIEPAINPE